MNEVNPGAQPQANAGAVPTMERTKFCKHCGQKIPEDAVMRARSSWASFTSSLQVCSESVFWWISSRCCSRRIRTTSDEVASRTLFTIIKTNPPHGRNSCAADFCVGGCEF